MGSWSSVLIHVEMRFFVFIAIDFLFLQLINALHPPSSKMAPFHFGQHSILCLNSDFVPIVLHPVRSSSGEVPLKLFIVVSLVVVFMLPTLCMGITSILMYPSFSFF